MTHSPNHVHLNNVPHELGEYAVLLIGKDGKLLAHIFLNHPTQLAEMDEAILTGKKIKFGDININAEEECL